jgi:molybdenum cofactor cytidylyltransferase
VKPPRIAAVILAAGLSSRMGKAKLVLPLAGKPIIRHVAETALASHASPVIVVTGYNARALTATLEGLDVGIAENADYAMGLAESLKCGVKSVPPEADGVLVLLGDMPFVSPNLLNGLINAFDPAGGRTICLPIRKGQRGNPVLWGRDLFPELLTLRGDRGAKSLLAVHEDIICEVEAADDGALIDIDTAEDLKSHE